MVAVLRRTRVRLTLVTAGIFGLVATVGAVALWFTVSHVELGAVDATLLSQGQVVSSSINSDNGQISLGVDPLPAETSNGIAVGVALVSSGRVTATAGPAITGSQAVALARAGRQQTSPYESVNVAGVSQRVLALPVSGSASMLVLSRPLTETNQTLQRVGLGLGAVVVLLVAVVALLAYRLAGRALRPVEQMTQLAQDISDRDLHRRIELNLPDDELGRLATTLNGMLARLEASFAALQRFTADAAHELRAPLTLMHTELETAINSLASSTPVEEATLRSLLGETQRLSRLADQLLLLARADAGALDVHRVPVDIVDLVEETADRWRRASARDGVHILAEAPQAGVVLGDADLLRRLLDNLLSNAVRHTSPDGSVTVSAQRDGGGWQIAVADTGPGVPAALRPRLFDRFSRGDGARRRDSGGAGLGLSLCAAIAAAHGGDIAIDDTAPGGARFVVRLPG